jgi:hypothetical protein
MPMGVVVMDPFSAAALGAVLTGGIGFLYDQLGELLRRRRDRRESAAAKPVEIPSAKDAEAVLAGQLTAGPVDEQALDQHADQLAKLWGLLAPYASGLTPVDPSDRQLVEQVEAARRLLERIYRQHITFTGEQRPATGTPLDVQHYGDVGQYATQVIASGQKAVAAGGNISGTVITGDQATLGDRDAADRRPPPR